MNTNFYKYIKYFTKNVGLISQMGGNNKLFMQCEINNITKELFYNENVAQLIEKYIDNDIIRHVGINRASLFAQDIFMFFKDEHNVNHIVITRDLNNDDMENYKISSDDENTYKMIYKSNDNDLGGNFIASPNNILFYFGEISDELKRYFMLNSVKFVELKCSFGTNNNRHIDECMTFMPYGASKYKIWMYIIEDIALDADLVDKMSKKYLYNDEEFDYFRNVLQRILNSVDDFGELEGGSFQTFNMFEMPQKTQLGVDYDIDKMMKEIKDYAINGKIDKNKLKSDPYVNILYKLTLDELEWLTQIFNGDKYKRFRNLNQLKSILNAEQTENLNKISEVLFDKPYESSKENFILFPIKLIVNKNLNYRICDPPIFNRLCIESEAKCTILFPTQTDKKTKDILELELPLLKSFIKDDKVTNIYEVDTSIYHEGSKIMVGGDLHCLVKQRF